MFAFLFIMRRILSIVLFICLLPCYTFGADKEFSRALNSADSLALVNVEDAVKKLYNMYIEANDDNNDEHCGEALTHLGWALWLGQQSELAVMTWQMAQGYIADKSSYINNIANEGIGMGYYQLGDYSNSEAYLQKCLQAYRRTKNDYGQAMVLFYLGEVNQEKKNTPKALNYYNEGLAIAKKANIKRLVAAFMLNIGVITVKGDRQKLIIQAIMLAKQISNLQIECSGYLALAQQYSDAKRYDDALVNLRLLERNINNLDKSDPMIPQTYKLYGEVYSAQKSYDLASAYLLQYSNTDMEQQQEIKRQKAEFLAYINEISRRYASHGQEAPLFTIIVLVIIVVAVGCTAGIIAFRHGKKASVTVPSVADDSEKKTENLQNRLAVMTLYYRMHNNVLEKIRSMIREEYKMPPDKIATHIRSINTYIGQNLISEKENAFAADETDYNEFAQRLSERFPDLAEGEKETAYCYRLGLSTRQVAELTGKQNKTVTMARYRLRKSLGLAASDDLTEFLCSI